MICQTIRRVGGRLRQVINLKMQPRTWVVVGSCLAIVGVGLVGTAPQSARSSTEYAVAAADSPALVFSGGWTEWRMTTSVTVPELANRRPCLKLAYRHRGVSVCLIREGVVRVKHDGYRRGYKLAARVSQQDTTALIQLRTADLMLRSGRPQVSQACQRQSCNDVVGPAGPVLVPSQILAGCTAKAPWRVTRKNTREKVVALTLDGGPSTYTRGALRALKKHGVRATFFIVGERGRKYPDLLKRIQAGGHELANHSNRHPHVGRIGGSAVRKELRKTNRVLKRETGFKPCSFRAPYLEETSTVISAARSLGMITVGVDVDPIDWMNPGTSTIVNRTVSKARPGSVLLMHDGGGKRAQSIAALPGIVKKLRDRGYRFVTVPELFDLQPSYRE
jgi:peptidoglycan/xylan/chitin deacetylase (PgdA/CDA1 family)